ncbi:unnamed protein product [Protopolystoma xenopodis]|uniref:Uncharacterized protein n=1 Tax=Protopolystoma xenopodis TaxID=117903 RepID=A0A3S5CNN6_9PLAT|nr:unnamed protein product [Protopolystoma xenopodis]
MPAKHLGIKLKQVLSRRILQLKDPANLTVSTSSCNVVRAEPVRETVTLNNAIQSITPTKLKLNNSPSICCSSVLQPTFGILADMRHCIRQLREENASLRRLLLTPQPVIQGSPPTPQGVDPQPGQNLMMSDNAKQWSPAISTSMHKSDVPGSRNSSLGSVLSSKMSSQASLIGIPKSGSQAAATSTEMALLVDVELKEQLETNEDQEISHSRIEQIDKIPTSPALSSSSKLKANTAVAEGITNLEIGLDDEFLNASNISRWQQSQDEKKYSTSLATQESATNTGYNTPSRHYETHDDLGSIPLHQAFSLEEVMNNSSKIIAFPI